MSSSRLIATLSLVAIIGILTGCQTIDSSRAMDSAKTASRLSKNAITPKSNDYRDPTEDDGSEWSFVGEEGRAHQTPEKDPDWWWQEKILSPKARSIERNLGFE